MKFKYGLILALTVIVAISAQLYGRVDNPEGSVRNTSNSRFSTTAVGNVSPTFTTSLSITNVVLATPGIIGKIVFVPGAVGDTLKIYNSTTGAGASASTLLFESSAASPTMANSPTLQVLGAPVIYDLMPGWTFSTGITVITARTASTTLNHAFINWDTPQ